MADVNKPGEKFDPYDARDVEKPLSNCDALLSLVKCVVGSGCLALPLAFYRVGYIGGILMTIFMTAVLIFGLQLLITCMVESSRQNKLPPIAEIRRFNTQLSLFVGIIMFGTSSIGVMLAIESQMAKPGAYVGWFGVLNRCALFVAVTYILIGFMGYWRYGNFVAASVTLNMPIDEALAQVAKIFIAISVFFSFPLSGYVVAHWVAIRTVACGMWHAACGMRQATCLQLQLLSSSGSSSACLSGSRLQAHLTMLRNLCRYGNASALGPLRLWLLLGRPAACLIMPLMDCS
ncbi:hypothetical protein AWZ03_005067 [Drosophila navojoa]|uniref:Amino acid transporter transmembrane domain-containing protein n=1 Tax=Drosophila navojoa TaxID=7232 RepID=A0A484BIA8_DRONA|nr:hypothetical protein AWZ03_005067 [Drosophila navojoa]